MPRLRSLGREFKTDQYKLDPRTPVPLYFQIKEIIKQQIAENVWRPDQPIPPENALAEIYGVSVGTVKKALAELAHEGILLRRRGKGTFVSRPDFSLSFVTRFFPFGSNGRTDQITPGSTVLDSSVGIPPSRVASILSLGPRESVITIKRIRTLDSEPFAVEDLYLPSKLFRGFEKRDISSALLYPIYDAVYGIRVVRADEYLEPRVAIAMVAQHLRLQRGDPVIFIERIAYTFGDRPVEYRQTYGRAGRVRYHARLR